MTIKHRVAILAASLACGIFGTALPAGAKESEPPSKAATARHQARLQDVMRKLWADHVVWTRQYIVAAVAGTPDAKTAAGRLLQNQEEIGKSIVPYYGADAGAKLTELLKQHILIAVDVVAAAKAADDAKLKDADDRWHRNAQDLSSFLSGANPNWEKAALTAMFNEHLAVTTQETVARIKQDWEGDVTAFDRVFDQAMMMADDLSTGITKQFPDRF